MSGHFRIPGTRVSAGSIRLASLLATWTALTPAALAQEGTSRAESREGEGALIVVTARKRTELLQDIPLAITAMTGEDLQERGAAEFVDYARSIPGLSFTDLGAGRQKVALRGINVTIGAATVGYYLGETPIPATGGTLRLANPDPKLVDVERVEVLRGPQGTLYGSGSIGGTIRLLPRRPDFGTVEGWASGELSVLDGGGEAAELQGVVNLPIAEDRLALRVAGWITEGDGFIDRLVGPPDAQGEVRDARLVEGDLPYESTSGFRATLGAAISEDATLDLMAYRQHQRFSGFQDITGGVANPEDRQVQLFLADVSEPSENSFWLYNATANVDLGPTDLVSSTSYFRGRQEAVEEGTAVIQRFFGSVFGNSLTETNSSRSFSHETRLSANDFISGLDGVAGVFYNHERRRRSSQWIPEGFGDEFGVGTDVLFSRFSVTTNRQWAVFGEITYHITDALSVTGGVRHFDHRFKEDSTTAGLFFDPANPEMYDDPPTLRSSENGEVYKANISYDLTEDHLVYATYSEGFRSGFGIGAVPAPCEADLRDRGFMATPTQVRPDELTNYEAGAKTVWLAGDLTVNAAVYQIDWSNIQQSVFLPCGFSLIVNSGQARSRGIEGEVNARLSPMLSIGGTLAYTRAEVLQAEAATGAREGDQIIDVPEWQGSAYAEYVRPLTAALDLDLRADFQYTGTSVAGYLRLPSGARDPLLDKGALTLINLRAGVAAETWSVTLFVQNLLNDVERQAYAESLVLTVPTRPRYVVNRPRMFGIVGRIEF